MSTFPARRWCDELSHEIGESFDQYLTEINAIQLLTAAEELTVATRAASGDEEAQHQLVRHNLRFVVAMAKRRRGRGLALEDLVAEGNVGLLTAARKFDPGRGVKFISYAVWWIRQAMLQAVTEQGQAVRLPLSQGTTAATVYRHRHRLRLELGHDPKAAEIAEAAELDVETVERFLSLARPVALNKPIGEDGQATVGDVLADADQTQDTLEDEMLVPLTVATLLAKLPPREAVVIRRCYGLDGEEQTLEEIAVVLGVSRERVRQIRERALRRMREPVRPAPRWERSGRTKYQRYSIAAQIPGAVAAAACA